MMRHLILVVLLFSGAAMILRWMGISPLNMTDGNRTATIARPTRPDDPLRPLHTLRPGPELSDRSGVEVRELERRVDELEERLDEIMRRFDSLEKGDKE